MARARVEGPGHEARDEEVEHRVPSKDFDDERVEADLGDEVEYDPARWRDGADEAWSEGVEEDLERAVRVDC